MELVTYVRDGSVGRIVLRRPDHMNAINAPLLSELFDAVRAANDDASVRAVVVSGEGQHFCAGADLEWEGELDEHAAMALQRRAKHLAYELRNGPHPFIGAIRGYCVGGGNELNLHLDVSIASETARFAQPETRWGILPFWDTPILLPLIVGERKAREMLLFGRMYDADQALELGLCNMVVPDDELEAEADDWAGELVDRSPTATGLLRIALNAASDQLAGAANHQAALAAATAGSERYRAEIDQFFGVKGSRRPRPARARRRGPASPGGST
jgi:enoyl-CoA hydratase/carnithine racemase